MRNITDSCVIPESKLDFAEFLWSLYKVRHLCLWVAPLALSVCFPRIGLQLLVVALIVGIRWAAVNNFQHRNIVILKGGEKNGVE